MQELRESLIRLIDSYFEVERNKNRIEGETAYVITNSKYYENLRHAVNHTMRALEFYLKSDPPNLPQFRDQYEQAYHHFLNLDVNGYEYLAGIFLEELREKIETSGFFHTTGNAEDYRKNALRHFDLGREKRTPDRNAAMQHFEQCIHECKKGLQGIQPVSKIEKRSYRVFAWTLLVAIAALVVALIALFK